MSLGMIFGRKPGVLFSTVDIQIHWSKSTAVWLRSHPNPDIFLVSLQPISFSPQGELKKKKKKVSCIIKIHKPKFVFLTLQNGACQTHNQFSPSLLHCRKGNPGSVSWYHSLSFPISHPLPSVTGSFNISEIRNKFSLP